jgi:hypothetical protein
VRLEDGGLSLTGLRHRGLELVVVLGQKPIKPMLAAIA